MEIQMPGFRGNEYMEIQGSEVVNMDIRSSEYRKFNLLENLYGKVGELFRPFKLFRTIKLFRHI